MARQPTIAALAYVFLVLLALMPFAAARAETNIVPTLVAESSYPEAGGTVAVAIVMTPKPDWHGYWKTPGDAGFPNEFAWTVPSRSDVGALRYPVPQRLLLNGLMNHVFKGEYALLTTVKLPPGLPPGTRVPLQVKGRWLACTDRICVPEEGQFGTVLTIGDGRVEPAVRTRFDQWRMRLTRPLGSVAHFDASGPDTVRFAIPLPASVNSESAWFFAETERLLSFAAPQAVSRSGDALIVEASKAQYGFETPKQVRGVLALKDGTGFEIEAEPSSVAPSNANRWQTTLFALLGALVGGMLLNIMPCVFPIISLKALSLARAGGNEAAAKAEALAYSAGVILTCLSLGGLLLGLRASGVAVGWAFQLQDPRVIFFLLLLAFAITLNLLGMFSFRGFGGGDALAAREGKAGAFWTGALAAFVATPCTGPFMAAALGAALVLPVPAALSIFAGLGLGLAAPFILIAYVPALRSRLPRPGPWMATFQWWMAVPMALTALALLWLIWRQAGQVGLLLGIGGCGLVIAGGWLATRARPAGVSLAATMAGLAAVALIAAPLISRFAPINSAATRPTGETFSEARLAELRREGRPVFLYFTADWCVSCKVNERVAIDRAETRAAFKAANVAILVGDWTNGDPAITRFLEAKGRSGVPLYLYYSAGGEQPRILPQLLTPAMLTSLK